jgi:hypothetical protein
MKFLQPSSCEIIPRNQLGIMFVRGVVGLVLMAWSFEFLVSLPLLGFSMLGISIFLLKGCPACWGMHMVNIARNKIKAKSKVDEKTSDNEEAIVKRPYQPKDMAEHLFPPEDVARFRRERQVKENDLSIQQKDSYV